MGRNEEPSEAEEPAKGRSVVRVEMGGSRRSSGAAQEQNQGWSNKSKGQNLGSTAEMENSAVGHKARCLQGTWHSLSLNLTSPCQPMTRSGSSTVSPRRGCTHSVTVGRDKLSLILVRSS